MATITEKDLNNGERVEDGEGKRDLEGAFAGKKAKLKGLNAIRRPTALVSVLLERCNNFFATGNAGLFAVGIEKGARALVQKIKGEKKANPDYDPSKFILLVPQIAEAAALLTCTDEELDACDDDIKNVRRLARKIMREMEAGEIIQLVPAIDLEFDKIKRSSATVPEDDRAEPESIAISPKKKRDHAG